jgi:hypothetical protein
VNFAEYLLSKKIDAEAFERSEKTLFDTWKREFEQMHPNSFTVQKLNLINPIRRKYLIQAPVSSPMKPEAGPAPATSRLVMKPKPKIN